MSQLHRGTQFRVITVIVVSVGLLAGCAAQHTLKAGAKYAEAYSKVGGVVEETINISEDATQRDKLAQELKLQPSDSAQKRVIDLACSARSAVAARIAYAAQNLSNYEDAVEALATAPDDSVAGIVGGLRKALPTSGSVIASPDDFAEAEQQRTKTCAEFAHFSLTSPQAKAFGEGEKVTAVLSILKSALAAIEAERRAAAYRKLVIALDQPIQDNLKALQTDMSQLLHESARASLRATAASLEACGTDCGAFERAATLETVMGGVGRFERSFIIFEGLYSPVEGGENVFEMLESGHSKIVAAAKSGKLGGAEGIDDLLSVLALVKDIGDNLHKL